MITQQISISEARAQIARIVDQAFKKGKTFEVTKGGTSMAFIVGINKMEELLGKDAFILKDELVKETKQLRAKSKKLEMSTADLLKEAREIREKLYA